MIADGLVLAGGRSSRFGSDKRHAVLGGKTLLEIAVDKLRAICSGTVMIAAGSRVDEIAAPKGVVVIPDAVQGAGPLGGILSGLLRTRTGILVLACDLPWVRQSTLRALARKGQATNKTVAVRSPRGWEPLVAYYPASVAPVVSARIKAGALAAHKLLDSLGAQPLACSDADEMGNVNRPGDLKPASS